MAIIGKAKAFLAWLLWDGVHVLFLIGFRNRRRFIRIGKARLVEDAHPC